MENYVLSYAVPMSYTSDITARINHLLHPDRFDHPLLAEFVEPLLTLAKGGKRTRAAFVIAGWQAAGGDIANFPLHAATAVELYQLSALVHDDLIDNAQTRRSSLTPHIGFAQIHARESLQGSPSDFGAAGAILLGDYLLSLAMEEIALAEAVSPQALAATISLFASMTAETAFGQYLDIRSEHMPLSDDTATEISRAMAVLLHKSARYSVESPLLLGATLRDADGELLETLSRVGRPLGEAFQLRDDDLGIFGDPETTGKPVGSDWTEGKRTVLLALARSLLTGNEREQAESLLGTRLSDSQARLIQELIIQCGARDQHEAMIQSREDLALEAADDINAPLLHSLIGQLMGRET